MFELTQVLTADKCVLHGAVSSAGDLSPLAFVLIHGTGSNFYAPGVLERFAVRAAASGATACRINTRGHDGIASIPTKKKSLQGGATYEVVSDCVHDIAAWCDWLVERGHQRIVLVGHSMGGVKAIYSQVQAPHSAVAAVVGISPPRFCHQHWMTHPKADAFRAHWQRAGELIAAGQPDGFLECTQPTPFLATAAGFVEKYGPEDRYDYLPLLGQLRVPALLMVGSETLNSSPAFDGLPAWMDAARASASQLSFEIVPGANMGYSDQPDAPWQVAERWLSALPSAA